MQIDHLRVVLVDGQEVCIAKRAMVSAYMVVADELKFTEPGEGDFFARVREGERFPVVAYLGDETEKVVGEAFMYPQTPSRLHIGIWKTYVLNPSSGRWEG